MKQMIISTVGLHCRLLKDMHFVTMSTYMHTEAPYTELVQYIINGLHK